MDKAHLKEICKILKGHGMIDQWLVHLKSAIKERRDTVNSGRSYEKYAKDAILQCYDYIFYDYDRRYHNVYSRFYFSIKMRNELLASLEILSKQLVASIRKDL